MNDILEQFMTTLRQRHAELLDQFQLPPPSFTSMHGEILAFDANQGWLEARFPILESQLNAYHTMQGGFLAAAVDNTLGPLSLLVAPPNFTRRLELTYSRPASVDMGYLTVRAYLVRQDGRWLEFRADVHDPQGHRLGRAKASHWIID